MKIQSQVLLACISFTPFLVKIHARAHTHVNIGTTGIRIRHSNKVGPIGTTDGASSMSILLPSNKPPATTNKFGRKRRMMVYDGLECAHIDPREPYMKDYKLFYIRNSDDDDDDDGNPSDNDNVVNDPSSYYDYYPDEEPYPKDLSSYFHSSETTGDYTNLLHLFKAPCEYLGGTLHSISGNQTCSYTSSPSPPSKSHNIFTNHYSSSSSSSSSSYSVTYVDTNSPLCVPRGCTSDETSTFIESYFAYCTEDTASAFYNSEPMESKLSQECQEGLVQLEYQNIGPVSIAYNINWTSYLVTPAENNATTHDFENALEEYKKLCEDAGGILYKASDNVMNHHVEGYNQERNVALNYPICLALSCDEEDVSVYFEEIFVPTQMFLYDGNFRDGKRNSFYDGEPKDAFPISRSYEFLGYESVSSLRAPNVDTSSGIGRGVEIRLVEIVSFGVLLCLLY